MTCKTFRSASAFLLLTAAGPVSVEAQCLPLVSTHAVSIHEFLASNTRTNPDRDFGEYSDWVELRNREEFCVDLGGSLLTDDLEEFWSIPAGVVVPARGFRLIWADGRDTSGLNHHAGFKLNKEGESIALLTPDRALVDSVSYPEQVADVSYGRPPDGKGWFYLADPTPGGENHGGRRTTRKRADAPEFFPPAGFCEPGQEVAIEPGVDGGAVHYSTDGSIPTARSPRYDAPIRLPGTTVLRARTYHGDLLPSETATRTYLVDEPRNLPVVSLATNPENLWDPFIGIYAKGLNGAPRLPGETAANFYQDWERPFNLEFFDDEGEQRINQPAGAKIAGFSSRWFAQKSFAVYARRRYGRDRFDYRMFPGKGIERFRRFLLRNSGNDHTQTQFHDGMTQTLIAGRMDLDYQAYQPAVTFINGRYWGIMNVREKMDDHYPESNYGIGHDEVEFVDMDQGRGPPNPEHYEQTLDFVRNNSLRNRKNYEKLKTRLDVDAFIDYYIFFLFIANKDWSLSYANSKAWRPQSEDGRWRWLVFDTDGSFGQSERSAYTSNDIGRLSEFFIGRLIENATFRSELIQRFAAHLNSTFLPERVIGIIDSLQAAIEPEMPRHIERFRRPADMDTWREYVEARREFARHRPPTYPQPDHGVFSH